MNTILFWIGTWFAVGFLTMVIVKLFQNPARLFKGFPEYFWGTLMGYTLPFLLTAAKIVITYSEYKRKKDEEENANRNIR